MQITVISFSGRRNGNCQRIAKRIMQFFECRNAVLYDFSDFSISPCGKCQLECFKEKSDCSYFGDMERAIYDSITNSDMSYFIVPNYCDFPCSNFFAFNERSQCYFQGEPELLERYEAAPKRFIVVSNTGKDNFVAAFSQHVSSQPDILFLSAKTYGKISINGDLLSSAEAADDILSFIKAAVYDTTEEKKSESCVESTDGNPI